MKKLPFTGSATAMVTPFLPDGSVNYDKLGQLIEFQISSGTDAIVVLGTSGENATLNDNERREIIRFSVECVLKGARYSGNGKQRHQARRGAVQVRLWRGRGRAFVRNAVL